MSPNTFTIPPEQQFKPGQLMAFVENINSGYSAIDTEKLRSLFERRATTIKGFNNNLSVEMRGVKEGRVVREVSYDKIVPHLAFVETTNKDVETFVARMLDYDLKEGVTFDVLFVEPSSDGHHVLNAWYCAKMQVKVLTTVPAYRDPMVDKTDLPLVTVKFDCVVRRDTSFIELAKKRLAEMHLTAENSYTHEKTTG